MFARVYSTSVAMQKKIRAGSIHWMFLIIQMTFLFHASDDSGASSALQISCLFLSFTFSSIELNKNVHSLFFNLNGILFLTYAFDHAEIGLLLTSKRSAERCN